MPPSGSIVPMPIGIAWMSSSSAAAQTSSALSCDMPAMFS